MHLKGQAIGLPLDRIDGLKKVTGSATYAYEYTVEGTAYAFALQSAIAKGRVVSIDASSARELPGVLAVLSQENAPRLAPLANAELAVFQSDAIAYRGQFVAAVVAETFEIARQAASLIAVRYEEQHHDVELTASRRDLYKPERLLGGFEADTSCGDVETALARASVSLDHTYTTPPFHANPLEPHATLAVWGEDGVTLYDANQGPAETQDDVARAFGLPPERVRVIAPYVGGGFGSKGFTHAHVIEQNSSIQEFAEQTAVATRMMYAAPNRRTTHRLARLDVPPPTIMRAPGECPGMFALESAMDELALACGLDPIDLRIRNEPAVDPETGRPFSTRGLVACLRAGAQRFGWQTRDPQQRTRRDGCWLIGTGVAASTYPCYQSPATARVSVDRTERYRVSLAASDIGTGAWTVLTQIAADALEVGLERVQLEIGDSALPRAGGAGGSSGTASWGSAIVEAARELRAKVHDEYGGVVPAEGLEATGQARGNPEARRFSLHAFGAQFAEARVNEDTGEVRLPRLLGVFAAGCIINPKTARSQLLGGMTMGLSMALHEQSVLDPRFGDYVNHDFAEYHVATNADVGEIDVTWIEEEDPHVNSIGAKGIGELGIVGTAAAIANAVYHATGIRVRDLPITLDNLLT